RLGVEARGARLATEALDILSVDQLSFELEETPRPGRPLRIEALTAAGVRVRRARRGAGVLGRSDFLLHPAGPSTKPSEVFRLRAVQLEDVELHWSPREDEQLVLEGIDVKIDVDRSRADEGVYAIELDSKRGELVGLSARVTLDVNAFALDIRELEL